MLGQPLIALTTFGGRQYEGGTARSTRVLQYCHFDNFVLLTSSRLDTYMSKRKLTKEMADAFVESIIIHGKYDYEIKLVYDDQFADLQKLKKEKEAQSR